MEYIYQLTINNKPFYVGRTNNPNRRLNEHLAEAKKGGSSSKCAAIRAALEDDLEVELVVVLEVDNGLLGDAEDTEIANLFGAGYRLTNQKRGDTGALSPRLAAALKKDIAAWKAKAKKTAAVKKRLKNNPTLPDCCPDRGGCGCVYMCKTQAKEAAQLFEQLNDMTDKEVSDAKDAWVRRWG